ncbi:MAG: hypothetical protein GY798_19955 [Hyphomicrobiales bacterium]|nr:hypothetical protein [Hyphomicrobiales bacterium]
MIEAIMFFALGLLTAGLLALAIAPAMWRRADRLARTRIESALPLSMAEIQADKDQLRANFAMSARRLELQAEQLESGANVQKLEISRSRTEIARLEADRAAKIATIETLEERISGLNKDVEGTERQIVEARTELAARDVSLSERAARIKGLEAEFAAAEVLSEEQKLELVARETTIGNLDDSLADARTAEAEMGLARDALAAELEAERAARAAELEAERAARATELEAERAARATELEAERAVLADERRRAGELAARITAFEAERADRLATLERRAEEIKMLRAELAAARVQRENLAADLGHREAEKPVVDPAADAPSAANGAAIVNTSAAVPGGDNINKAIAAIEAEKESLTERLATTEADRDTLRAENAELRRIAGPDWDVERAADQRIRDQLSQVASTVIRMAAGGESAAKGTTGQNGGDAKPSPEPPDTKAADGPTPPKDGQQPTIGQTLARRIRALQHSAARQ